MADALASKNSEIESLFSSMDAMKKQAAASEGKLASVQVPFSCSFLHLRVDKEIISTLCLQHSFFTSCLQHSFKNIRTMKLHLPFLKRRFMVPNGVTIL